MFGSFALRSLSALSARTAAGKSRLTSSHAPMRSRIALPQVGSDDSTAATTSPKPMSARRIMRGFSYT